MKRTSFRGSCDFWKLKSPRVPRAARASAEIIPASKKTSKKELLSQPSPRIPYTTQHSISPFLQQQIKWLSDHPVEVLVEEATVVAVAAVEAEVRAVDQEVSVFTAPMLLNCPFFMNSSLYLAYLQLYIQNTLRAVVRLSILTTSLHIHSCDHAWSLELQTNNLQAALAVIEADAVEDAADSTVVEDVAVEHQEAVEATEAAVVVEDEVELLEGLK